jgi:hypothetical protein
MRTRLLALLLAAVLVAACGGGDDDDGGDAAGGPGEEAAETTTTAGEGGGPATLPAACELVPTDAANEATGLSLGPGAEIGDDRRAVCAFSAPESGGVGVTVGVELGGRFDEKAQASRDALEVDGEEIGDLGDRALWFYSDEDVPEGLGGVLVGVGDLTIDVTVQGAGDEATTREASLAITELALSNLP